MITRKENLLVRPFQYRKYIQHRQKVITALPRIDDVTPPKRNHVYIKCKKIQTEAERHARIERDNFILLKHLNDIMSIKRVDNCWLYEHPKFLHRIKLFRQRSTIPEDDTEFVAFPKSATKKERCVACHPENYVKKEIIPEERIPWEIKPVRDVYSADLLARRKKNIPPPINSAAKFNHSGTPKSSKLFTLSTSKSSTKNPPHSAPPPLRLPKSSKNKPKQETLTVVIKFPPESQVTLNAGISDQIT